MNGLDVLVCAYKNSGADILIFSDSFKLLWRNRPDSGFMCGGEDLVSVIGGIPLLDNGFSDHTVLYGGKKYSINIFECPFDDELFYAAEVSEVSESDLVTDPQIRRLLDDLSAQVASSLNNAGFALDNLAKCAVSECISQLNVIDDSLMGIYRTVLPFRELIDLHEEEERPVCCVTDILEKLCADLKSLLPAVELRKNIMAGIYAKCTKEALNTLLYNFAERAFANNYGCLMVNCITTGSGEVQISLTAAGESNGVPAAVRYEETGGDDPTKAAEICFREQFCRQFGAACVVDIPSKHISGRSASMSVRIPIERAGSLILNAPKAFEFDVSVGRFHPLRVKLSGHIKFPRFKQGEKYEA